MHAFQADLIAAIEKFSNVSEVNMNSRLVEDIGLNSLTLVKLTVALEETFQIDFDPLLSNLQHFSTVDRLAAYIASQQAS